MRTKVKELFEEIDRRISEMTYEEVRDSCNLLSVLRGPDSDDSHLKEKCTVPFRVALFPKSRMMVENTCWDMDTRTGIEDINISEFSSDHHFSIHIEYAKKAYLAKDDDPS